jgi:hypothetical protein
MTLTFDIQAPSGVEWSGETCWSLLVWRWWAPHRCHAGGMTALSLDRAPFQNSKNHWCFSFDSKQRVLTSPQPSVIFTILTQWYTQTSKERELPRNLTCFLSLVLWQPLILGTAVSSMAPPQTCQQIIWILTLLVCPEKSMKELHATLVTNHDHRSVMCSAAL